MNHSELCEVGYQLFLGGLSPTYTYRTWSGLRKRLLLLARDSALTKGRIVFNGESIPVEFNRGPFGYGWQTPVGRGIPHDNGLRMSSFQRQR